MPIRRPTPLKRFRPRRSDFVVLILGVSGSGKTTFISQSMNKRVTLGPGLKKDTAHVAIYSKRWSSKIVFHLIDTPGFGHGPALNKDNLREIVQFLIDSYRDGIRVHGILYLHPITQARMDGLGMTALRILQKFCGPSAAQNLFLVSTKWDLVDSSDGAACEDRLMNEFWRDLISQGARVRRHDNTRGSTRHVLQGILDRDKVSLGIQEEMANNSPLVVRSVGTQLEQSLLRNMEIMESTSFQVQESLFPVPEVNERRDTRRSWIEDTLNTLIEESRIETPQDQTAIRDGITLQDPSESPETTFTNRLDSVLKST